MKLNDAEKTAKSAGAVLMENSIRLANQGFVYGSGFVARSGQPHPSPFISALSKIAASI
jgi:hypothetical protein